MIVHRVPNLIILILSARNNYLNVRVRYFLSGSQFRAGEGWTKIII